MANPKIVYNSITLNFLYPPVSKSGDFERSAVRHDTVCTGGVVQFMTERVDIFLTLQMDYVLGPNSSTPTDLTAWAAFIDYANTGLTFLYYPDSASSTHDEYTLEDTDWDPKYAFHGVFKFKLKLRKYVSGSGGSTPAPPPSVTSVSPTSGGYLDTLVISGANFVAGCLVEFIIAGGGAHFTASMTFVSGSSLSVIVPNISHHSLDDIKVTNPDGQSNTLANAFTWNFS